MKVFAALLITCLTGCTPSKRCADGPPDRSYRNHVSDVESENKIKGVTYDSGPAHPTFWEMVFTRLGVK